MKLTIRRMRTRFASAWAIWAGVGPAGPFWAAALAAACEVRGMAPYPAWSTASLIAASTASSPEYVTSMLFLSRLTTAFSTPGTALVVFSTRAEHAAQVIPVTSNT